MAALEKEMAGLLSKNAKLNHALDEAIAWIRAECRQHSGRADVAEKHIRGAL